MIYLRKRLNHAKKQAIPFKKSKRSISLGEKPIVRAKTSVKRLPLSIFFVLLHFQTKSLPLSKIQQKQSVKNLENTKIIHNFKAQTPALNRLQVNKGNFLF